MRSLAAHRPPEAIALAEATIKKPTPSPPPRRTRSGLVDFLADDLPDLLRQLDGFHRHGRRWRHHHPAHHGRSGHRSALELHRAGAGILINPNVVFLLLSLGPLLILNELSSPGGWVAGFLGVVCMLLAFYGLGVLPVNWFGLIFVVVAFVLFVMEVTAPTHGGLAVAGHRLADRRRAGAVQLARHAVLLSRERAPGGGHVAGDGRRRHRPDDLRPARPAPPHRGGRGDPGRPGGRSAHPGLGAGGRGAVVVTPRRACWSRAEGGGGEGEGAEGGGSAKVGLRTTRAFVHSRSEQAA